MPRRTSAEIEHIVNTGVVQNDTGDITAAAIRSIIMDVVDSGPIGMPGNDARTALKWLDSSGWTPVSDTTTQYLIVTRTDAYATLAAALVAHLTAGGSENALPAIPAFVSARFSSYASIGGVDTGGNDALLSDLWPAGAAAPFVWLVTPTAHDWLERSRVNVSVRPDNTGAGTLLEPLAHFGRLPYTVMIDGAQFDIGRYHTMLDRPADLQASPNQAALRFQYQYEARPAAVPTVTQVL